MTYVLKWDDGTGRMIQALYETEAEAVTQAAADEEQFPGRAGSQVVEVYVEPVPVEQPAGQAPVDPAPDAPVEPVVDPPQG